MKKLLKSNRMTKKLFRNNYVTIEFYWKGMVLGFYYDDSVLTLLVPFFSVEVHFYNINRKKPTKF